MNKLKVDGMHCQNCVKAVTEAVSALPGAKGVQVSLEKGEVTWEEMGVEISALMRQCRHAAALISKRTLSFQR